MDNPFLVVKLESNGYSNRTFKVVDEALAACDPQPGFDGELICVYNLITGSFLAVEGVPNEVLNDQVYDVIKYYSNDLY